MTIQNTISSWAKSNEITLLTEDGGSRRQFFYVPSRQGAMFQIVIEPVHSEIVRIDVHLIEGPDYDEAHFILEVPWARIRHALDLSLVTAQFWFEKLRQPKN
jgi:hypothetical protein